MLSHSLTRWPRYLVVILFTMLAGCLDTGDGEDPVSDPVLTGVLLDGPTSGVSYVSETQSGITNANGEFSYYPGETIVFSIGGIRLGQVLLVKPVSSVAKTFVTPVELTGSTDASDPKVIRLLQFLQSLDSDGDHSNGISISATTRSAASSLVINFADTDFAVNNPTFNLQSTIDDLSDPDDPVPAIVSAGQALQNFTTTIQDNGLNISLTPSFQLVWADEFNAASLDAQSWNFETGYGPGDTGWGNDEWQQYTQNSENLAIVFEDGSDASNGYLKISAQCPAPGVDNAACQKRDGSITSAKINTKGKHEFQFGKIEARIKVPTGKGAWPAFWSLGAGFPETPWPAAGEIDFMEVFNVNNNITKDGLFTIHWEEPDGSGTRQFSTTAKSINAENFHIFEAEWNQNRIIGKIDRVEFANYPINPATQSEFLKPFYLILNLAMGGNPLPDLVPDSTTPWPQEMLVDYIRVYQAVAGLNNDIINIGFEGASDFVCFEDGSGCGSPSGFAGGDASVQANPSTEGNSSANAARFQKFNPGNGEAFGGTLVRLTDNALDFAASNNIFTVKVYSTRSVPVRLELGDDNPNDGSPGVDVVHSGSGWEELTFDVSGIVSQVTKFNQIVFIFDNGTLGDAQGDLDNGTTNWTFYFDDIVLQKAPVIDDGTGGGDFGDGSSDGTGFGIFSETNTTSAVTNTNIVSAGNAVTIDGTSTAVTPFDGSSVLALTYSGNTQNQGFGGAVFQFDSANVSAFDTLKFTIDTASFTNFANLTVQMEPPGGGTAGGNVALASYTPVAVLGNWKTYEIPLADFTAVNPASISALGFFNARDAGNVLLAGTLYLDDIHFTGAAGGTGGTGGVALPFSDDFESGDLAGWDVSTTGGSISADNTQAAAGTWSARLVVGQAQTAALKLSNLGIGDVIAGDLIDVSFDICGTITGVGGEIQPALLTEEGIGGAASRDNFGNIGSAALPSVWTRQTYSDRIAAANVGGGITLQLDAVCGGDVCGVDVYIDNVSITKNGGDLGSAPASGLSCATGAGGGGATQSFANEVLYSSDTTAIPEDFVSGVNYGTITPFDSGSVIAEVTSDPDYSRALGITSGFGYGGNVMQVAFPGFAAGFISSYESIEFKVKNPATNIIRFKAEPEGTNPFIQIDLTTDARSTSLGNDWYQVVIPISEMGTLTGATQIVFEDNTDFGNPTAYQVLLTDIGFNYFADEVLYSSDAAAFPENFVSGVDYGTITPFDSGSVIAEVTSDPDYSRALGITSGFGYGGNVMQVAFPGFAAGFISSYESIEFKVKNPATNIIRFKAEPEGTNPFIQIDLTTDARSTSLGNDWYQVVIPISEMGTLTGATQIVFEDNTDFGNPTAYQVLLTDIGFNYVIATGAGGGGGGQVGVELAVNGDFETGDYTGWEQFVNSGAQSISTDTPDASTSSAAVSGNTAPGAGGTSEIKQTERGVGDLALGDTVKIQFDVKGTFGPGGQMNVLSFTEQTVGATQNNNTIVDGAFTNGTAIGNGWFSYDYNVTLAGSDIGRGFSLAFNPVCGAVAGCVADVLIDNVSIVKQ